MADLGSGTMGRRDHKREDKINSMAGETFRTLEDGDTTSLFLSPSVRGCCISERRGCSSGSQQFVHVDSDYLVYYYDSELERDPGKASDDMNCSTWSYLESVLLDN